MAWCSSCVLPLLLAIVVQQAVAADRLRVAYEWKQIDFAYRTAGDRQAAIEDGTFVPENVIPVGVERHEQRLFVTLPRWKTGVPASLAYIDMNDTSTKSPLLHPYPSWGAHTLPAPASNNDSTTSATPPTPAEIVSPFRVRADRCNRLWVLDTGTADLLSDHPAQLAATQLLVYDLHNDNLLRRYQLPPTQRKHDSFFANIAVEVDASDCADAYAYLADLGAPGLVVYSWRDQESWRVQHHYFHPDPTAGDYNVAGTRFQWDDGLFGVALSAAASPADRRLYFHALSSTMEFSVRTQVLHNRTAATDFAEYRQHGSRGPLGQAGATFMADNGVIFYTMPNRNALTCWRAEEHGNITSDTLGVVLESGELMVFPNDVKVDEGGELWVLSDNLQRFTYGQFDEREVNFRILRGSVREAIAGTVCEGQTMSAAGSAVEVTPAPEPTSTEHDHSAHGHVHGGHGVDDVQRTRARPPTAAGPNGAATGSAAVQLSVLLAAFLVAMFV